MLVGNLYLIGKVRFAHNRQSRRLGRLDSKTMARSGRRLVTASYELSLVSWGAFACFEDFVAFLVAGS